MVTACTTTAIALAGAALFLSACSIDGPDPAPGPTTSWGPVRHETAPLRKHFPDLGIPIKASWTTRTGGDAQSSRDFLPSPSSTFVSAVVEVEPGIAQDLRSTFGRSGKTQLDDGTWVDDPDLDDDKPELPATPDVAPPLRPAVHGPFVRGTSSMGSTYGWDCTVYVNRDNPIVIVQAILPWATSFED
ncbi:MAG: hypothetical protein WAV90_04565 [Gordonia amarae]